MELARWYVMVSWREWAPVVAFLNYSSRDRFTLRGEPEIAPGPSCYCSLGPLAAKGMSKTSMSRA